MFTHAVITIQLKLHLARFQLDFTQASYSPKSWLDYHSRYLNLLNVYNEFSECTFKFIWTVELTWLCGMGVLSKSMHIKFRRQIDFPSTGIKEISRGVVVVSRSMHIKFRWRNDIPSTGIEKYLEFPRFWI